MSLEETFIAQTTLFHTLLTVWTVRRGFLFVCLVLSTSVQVFSNVKLQYVTVVLKPSVTVVSNKTETK